MKPRYPLIWCLLHLCYVMQGQNFSQSNLDFKSFAGVSNATSLEFGPDGRLYVLDLDGQLNIYSTLRLGEDNYEVSAAETLNQVRNTPNHDDDGSPNTGETIREATGLTVVGTAANPIIYVTSSDKRIGGPSGDKNLDTNSGVITRLSWTGSSWATVDIVRGLPRSEENHATNGLEFATIGGEDFLLVCSGGHTNAGSPSVNFAWTTEYALSAAILSINLTMLEGMNTLSDNGRDYIYDIPTLDDPTRNNVHANGEAASEDPNSSNYSPIDIGDPWGGNDGLNQAMIISGGPVQVYSPGYRNAYDLVLTESGALYVTDNGPNGGWGGLPANEGGGSVTNAYLPSEPGSSTNTNGERVRNEDHLTKVANNIQTYSLGSFYGGHPVPVRGNPGGAGLYTNPGATSVSSSAYFRTQKYDPNGSTAGSTTNQNEALPANWPPVPAGDPRQGDFRSTGFSNPDGPDDDYVSIWTTNTNGIDEYTASNFGGAFQGNLIAGKSGGKLFRVQLDGAGDLASLDENFQTNLGGNPLGVTCNGDSDPHPGTIWLATFNGNIKVLEPADAINCYLPGHPSYLAGGDNDGDGYTNQDEIDNKGTQNTESVICNPGNQPDDFDKEGGGNLLSNLNDSDDDNDGILDANDPFQLGDFLTGGSDAFNLPVTNELESDNATLKGYLGLGFTGMMNNGSPGPNWLDWIDVPGDGPNPDDLLGGAVGAMTMHMGAGTALGLANSQRKAFQYGVQVDESTGGFTVISRLFNFHDPLQIYGTSTPANAELGIFIGDGTQSNYIKLVLRRDGVRLQQEQADIAGTPMNVGIPIANRPPAPNAAVTFTFAVDPSTGQVTGLYSLDQGVTFQNIGTLQASGTLLQAIQSAASPLAVGLIGTSNQSGAEVEGSWDFLNVQGSQPTIQQDIPDYNRTPGASDDVVNLNAYFTDDEGDGNLTYSVQQNTNSAVGASISGGNLTLSYPTTDASSAIIIRATDASSLYISQGFQVNVAAASDPSSIARIRAAGTTIAATDAPNPSWEGAASTGAFTGEHFSVNVGNISNQNLQNNHSSLPSYVPASMRISERWDSPGGAEMEFSIPVVNADYTVRLFLGNGYSGTTNVGDRVFDILMEGAIKENNFDPIVAFGNSTLGMREYDCTVADGMLNIRFEHEVENPNIFGIEVLGYPISVQTLADQNHSSGDLVNIPVYASGGTFGSFQYSATGLPSGIQIESTTGLIFGTLGSSASGNFSPVITVSKEGSIPSSESFAWSVSGPQWNDQGDDENYTARHECSFVQAGDKFFLFGGRESPRTLDVYDIASKSWTPKVNSAPKDFNHFQATEYGGLIWIIGAFKDNGFPNEAPEERIWMYNPASDEWIQGPLIPTGRRRGSAGIGVYNDKFYIVGGNTIGHNGGYVEWFDEFDPSTGVWTTLTDAPRTRDHFHAQVIGDKLYVAGGRRSGGSGGTFEPLIAEVDVYNFTTGTWSSAADIPTPRAAPAVAELEGKLFVLGGEIRTDLNGVSVNDAVRTTESYDPSSGQWATEPSLITERHGTQAITSGSGIHVASGSDKLGGGRIKKMEYFGDNNAFGTVSVVSTLSLPNSIGISAGGQEDIIINAVGGNVGIILQSATITGPDASSFTVAPLEFALLAAGSSKTLIVTHGGNEGGETATLTLIYNNGATRTISLNSVVDSGTLSMTVQLQGLTNYSGSIQVQLCDPATDQVVINGSYNSDATGQFVISDIPPGNYNVYIRKDHFLRKGIINVNITVGMNQILLLEVDGEELRTGDGNDDNAVSANDLTALKAVYYTFSGNASYDSDYDFNNVGGINILDFSLLASNYGEYGVTVCSKIPSSVANNSVNNVHVRTEPSAISLAEGEISSFFVVLDNPDEVSVDGVDFRMVYNPTFVEVLEVEDAYGWEHQLQNNLNAASNRIMYSGGSTSGSGPSDDRRVLKIKVMAKAAVGSSTFSFDRGEPFISEISSGGYAVMNGHTPLTIETLGPCLNTRMIEHSPVVDGEFMAGEKIMLMGDVEVFNSVILDAPLVSIPGHLSVPDGALVTVRKDGCN